MKGSRGSKAGSMGLTVLRMELISLETEKSLREEEGGRLREWNLEVLEEKTIGRGGGEELSGDAQFGGGGGGSVASIGWRWGFGNLECITPYAQLY
ncbi:hypothetical protein V6N13_095452 [Hibiscus sabdariffa]|uniref:Uncharacterized protein n=2 Tax=Hibiscus sabdariffa TaxID=183260 RepID=A0ABR2AW57_9ROSI